MIHVIMSTYQTGYVVTSTENVLLLLYIIQKRKSNEYLTFYNVMWFNVSRI